ncbi:hypothetical protein MRX96_040792 [Rhipicephalus microplus]
MRSLSVDMLARGSASPHLRLRWWKLGQDAKVALVKQASCMLCDTACHVRAAIYAVGIARFTCSWSLSVLLESLQMVIDAVGALLSGTGITLVAFKTEALLVHP